MIEFLCELSAFLNWYAAFTYNSHTDWLKFERVEFPTYAQFLKEFS